MDTQGENDHLQTKEKGFERNHTPYPHLGLGLPASRTTLLFKLPSLWYFAVVSLPHSHIPPITKSPRPLDTAS